MIVDRCRYYNCIFRVQQKNLFSNLLLCVNKYILIQWGKGRGGGGESKYRKKV